MKRWRVLVRRDTSYIVSTETKEEAVGAAETEDFSLIDEDELDWVRTLETWEVDEDGNPIVLEEEDEG